MNRHHGSGNAPHYTLGLRKVEIEDVLEACELVGQVLQAVAPEHSARAAARLLAEATTAQHDNPLARSILVEVARALQRRGCQ